MRRERHSRQRRVLENHEKLFSPKSNNFESLSLFENHKLLTNDSEVAESFHKYFENLMFNIDLKQLRNTRKR